MMSWRRVNHLVIPTQTIYLTLTILKNILGEIISYETYIDGNWSNTFDLPNVEDVSLGIERRFGDWEISEVSLSLLGISLTGKGKTLIQKS
ncbi:hypothetical protein FLK61_27360 [Paenalkalicoccus suaedae]|uniref:Uncharacterized protein n=1 Tax=Paenalkalicoccus suaedae TaxID=2592382 RepID=A0A859FE16_9BACI|nr:hypothetical protein FLK61_27360 [Paenalkalicoccus suaedae]